MLSFIWWLIIGLIAGALARLIMPGRDADGHHCDDRFGNRRLDSRWPGELGNLGTRNCWGRVPPGRSSAFDTRRYPRALDLSDG